MSEGANFRATHSSSDWRAEAQGLNPYALDVTPSGSSSRSAAAVAANLGTVTEGSIICPAAANGAVGIKPTVGLTSRTGVIPISQGQDTVGPLARTVADAALVPEVIAGADPDDPVTRSGGERSREPRHRIRAIGEEYTWPITERRSSSRVARSFIVLVQLGRDGASQRTD